MAAQAEATLFRARGAVLMSLALLTVLSVWFATNTKLDADFEKQLPGDHPFVQTVLDFREKIPGLNAVQITVETRDGDIWTTRFLKTLYDVTQEVFYLPGVSRTSVSSMWTSTTRVIENKEGEVAARDLIPGSITAARLSDDDVAQIKRDALKGGFQGWAFSRDMKAAMIQASILEVDPQTDKRVDYFEVAERLEQKIRRPFEKDGITIRIIGFTKFIGDVRAGAGAALVYFAAAFVLTFLAAWLYARSLSLALLAVGCSLASVVWQFGVIGAVGIGVNPLGIIIPFVVFSIGVSHGIQQINLIIAGLAQGMSGEEAARASFRRLLVPGGFALTTTLVAFLSLLLVPIPIVRDLAWIAIIGIAFKFVSNLIMLPLVASMIPVSENTVARVSAVIAERDRLLLKLSGFARPGPALIVLGLSVVVMGVAAWQGSARQVGDLKIGAPELDASSRYNQDLLAIAGNFNVDLDAFVIVAETPQDACVDYKVMALLERFGVVMRNVEGVKSILSLPEVARGLYAIVQEGNLKWRVLPKDPTTLVLTTGFVPAETGLLNKDCTIMPIVVYMHDHKAQTIKGVVAAARAFIAANTMPGVTFRLATGNAAVYAAMNDTVERAEWPTLALVFAAIIVLVLVAFRDWRAAVCCTVPLLFANFLGLWLMSALNIGLKVSTLPVFVLAVGIGVDYAFYVYARLMVHLRSGVEISDAYVQAMQETGVAVVFTGLTLAAGVSSWAFAPLQFQSDMGLLLAFMFLINMVGTVTLLPSLGVALDAVFPRRFRERQA